MHSVTGIMSLINSIFCRASIQNINATVTYNKACEKKRHKGLLNQELFRIREIISHLKKAIHIRRVRRVRRCPSAIILNNETLGYKTCGSIKNAIRTESFTIKNIFSINEIHK